MSKYSSLETHLRERGDTAIPMTFGEIEELIGSDLPPSAYRYRPWWSNNPTNSVMTRAWLDAGYISAEVDMSGQKLVFRRVERDGSPSEAEKGGPSGGDAGTAAVPGESLLARIFGALKGTVTVKPGTDLTKPVGEDWDATR